MTKYFSIQLSHEKRLDIAVDISSVCHTANGLVEHIASWETAFCLMCYGCIMHILGLGKLAYCA